MRTLDPDHDLYIDKDLIGAAMRDQSIRFYNLLAFWTERLGEFESNRKIVQAALEQAKDKAKFARSMEAKDKGFKASIQEAYIRNFHDVLVDIDGEIVTSVALQKKLEEIQETEIEARSNVNICQTGVDICRSALAFDRQEMSKMEADHR